MEPIHFPQVTNTLAKSQPQYMALPVCVQKIDEGTPSEHLQFTCRYELSDAEIAQIIRTKSFFISQYGSRFQPIKPQIESPFFYIPVMWERAEDNSFTAWVPMADGSKQRFAGETMLEIVDKICVDVSNVDAENIFFYEKPHLAIGDNGIEDFKME